LKLQIHQTQCKQEVLALVENTGHQPLHTT